ncbi:hypothetical protein PVK06_039685 [Gossypium arboreum]|uniref:Uncharacterized protein n=1 Tax=Gossypium arboreum TaxID=29729 RepID=A0ABR0N3J1_GOSAR|nr:hypothetical protein PVK06_039685 [Gossypium arboreum]
MVAHVLRDFLATRSVWQLVIPWSMGDGFWSVSIDLWLVENLCNCKDVLVEGVRWEVLFGALAWWIGMTRNQFIFSQDSHSAAYVVANRLSWAKVISDVSTVV